MVDFWWTYCVSSQRYILSIYLTHKNIWKSRWIKVKSCFPYYFSPLWYPSASYFLHRYVVETRVACLVFYNFCGVFSIKDVCVIAYTWCKKIRQRHQNVAKFCMKLHFNFNKFAISWIFLFTIWNFFHEFCKNEETRNWGCLNFEIYFKNHWFFYESTEFLVSSASMLYFNEFCKNFQRKGEEECIQE